MIRFVAWYYRA